MRWLAPQERDIASGSGQIVILGDRSRSIPGVTAMAISQAIGSLCAQHPGIRVFAFAGDVEEIDGERNRDFFNACPPEGAGTDIWMAFRRIRSLKPSKTILFSDGGCINKGATLRAVEEMTGSIDCYFCEPRKELFQYGNDFLDTPQGRHFGSVDAHYRYYTKDVDEAFMQQIARKGCGRHVRFEPSAQHLEQLLCQSIRSNPPMSDRYRVKSGTYHVHAPGEIHQEVVQDVHLYHKRRIHHHYIDDEHIEHGSPKHAEIEVEPAQGRISLGTVMKMIWQGPNYQAKREIDRGAISAAPAQQALPAPSRPGLPVPSAAQAFALRRK